MRRTHRRAGSPLGATKKERARTSVSPGKAAGARRKTGTAKEEVTPLLLSFQHLVGEVFRFNGRLLDAADTLAHDLPVTPTHWQIIAIVRTRPLTIPAISRLVGLRRQSVQHNIKQLVARGLIEQGANPDHRRASLIRLSDQGQRLMKVLLTRQTELAALFTAGLGLKATDLDDITRCLRRMREQADAITALTVRSAT